MEWRRIPRYPDYEVSSDGDVRSWRRYKRSSSRRSEPVPIACGYSRGRKIVSLRDTAKPIRNHTEPVSNLVLEAFVGPRPANSESRHFPDTNQSNCRLDNLSWVTRAENCSEKAARAASASTVGNRYGRLTVLSVETRSFSVPSGNYRRTFAMCRCDCGTDYGAWLSQIVRRESASCGCAQGTHRRSKTSEYRCLQQLVRRCTLPHVPSYADYGGRGITVCDRWRESFENFFADMGAKPSPRHSLDRIDNSRGYEPGNCRWATSSTQQRNRRVRADSKSQFRGVSERSGRRWVAYIVTDGKRTDLGMVASLEAAIAMRLAAEERHWCGAESAE